LAAVPFSPLGSALADRIRGRLGPPAPDPEILAELEHLREEVVELQERVDFHERLLAERRQAPQLEGGSS
jgi:hypothetical protein